MDDPPMGGIAQFARCTGRFSMPRGIIRTPWRLFCRFMKAHEDAIWSFMAGMDISAMPQPWCSEDPKSDIAPAPTDEDGCSPPPGHPEFLVLPTAPTPVERLLWAQLGEKLGP